MPNFIKDVLLRSSSGSIYVCTLPNQREGAAEKHVLTRDIDRIEKFITKWDQPERGLFFCVSTIAEGKPRRKEHYVESIFLHADIDFKDIECPPAEAEATLRGLPLPPCVMNFSGNGIHAYWLLDQPISDVEHVEMLLKRLAYILSADRMVSQCVALMRMPGSHNTKNGEWQEVTSEVLRTEPYTLAEIETWTSRAAPVIKRKGKESNPFLDAADILTFKPPIDVDERLAAMSFHGTDESGIHATQLSVTASLMNAGWEIDDVVKKVFTATERACEGEAWNWQKEEKAIRGMCEDWLKKHPRVKERKAEVVNLAEKRTERAAVSEKPAKAKVHVVLGTGILASLFERNQKLMICKGTVWLYGTDGLWQSLRGDEWKNWVSVQIEIGCRALRVVSTQKIVGETRAWLERNPDIHNDEVLWDDHGKIATKSGLVDFRTMTLEPYQEDHYATHCIESNFDISAACPMWQQMLTDMGFDSPTVNLVQEILGAALLDKKPRGLMRALVLVGGSNSGKSNLLRTMAHFLSDNPISTPLETVVTPHGLQDFLRHAPWVLDEAFDQGKWHASASVKALLSGDHIGINIKNGPMVTHCWRSAIFWGANTAPQFKEASRAMENRMAIVNCSAQFDPANPRGLALKAVEVGFSSPSEMILASERDGILIWALAGLQRAWANKSIRITEGVVEALHQMRLDSNMAAGFFEECVEFSRDSMVSSPDVYAAFSAWWTEGTDKVVPSPKAFGKSISALGDWRVPPGSQELRYRRIQQYVGIKLNETGLDFWKAQTTMSGARGETARISSSADEVNTSIPSDWYQKITIRKLQKLYKSQDQN